MISTTLVLAAALGLPATGHAEPQEQVWRLETPDACMRYIIAPHDTACVSIGTQVVHLDLSVALPDLVSELELSILAFGTGIGLWTGLVPLGTPTIFAAGVLDSLRFRAPFVTFRGGRTAAGYAGEYVINPERLPDGARIVGEPLGWTLHPVN